MTKSQRINPFVSNVRPFLRKMFYLLCVLQLISVATVKNSAVTAVNAYQKSYTSVVASNKYSKQANQQEIELDYTEMRGNIKMNDDLFF